MSASPLTMYGLMLWCDLNRRSKPTTRSRTTGKFCMGSTVTAPSPSSDSFVKHARRGLPFTIMPHDPHVACLQE